MGNLVILIGRSGDLRSCDRNYSDGGELNKSPGSPNLPIYQGRKSWCRKNSRTENKRFSSFAVCVTHSFHGPSRAASPGRTNYPFTHFLVPSASPTSPAVSSSRAASARNHWLCSGNTWPPPD